MANQYVLFKKNSIEQKPGWITDYSSYCSYGVGIISDEMQDLRVELDHIHAEIIPYSTAKGCLFADAYDGTISIKPGTSVADEFPQIVGSGEASKVTHTLSSDDVAQGVLFQKVLFKRIIRDRYNQHFLALTQASALEKQSWAVQQAEAEAWTADNSASTPTLSTLATARSLTVSALVSKINTKVTAYNSAVATLLGEQKDLEDEVDALTDVAGLHRWRHLKGISAVSSAQATDEPGLADAPLIISF
tara:strand:+ start:4389 stop:5129 length:741 start_codon:yes stop_codon:yes gene_type:complete